MAVCATLGALAHAVVQAQSARATIVGSVVDESLQPIAGAALTLARDGRIIASTTSDQSGAYRFTGVASGTYQVRASAPNRPTMVRDIHVPTDAATLRLPLVMAAVALDAASAEAPRQVGPPPPPGRLQTTVNGVPAASAPIEAPPMPASSASSSSRQQGITTDRIEGLYRGPYWPPPPFTAGGQPDNYAHVAANRFHDASTDPLSTFGADVDTASYTNVRRFLSQGQLPPRDAVRVEEFVNYFHFDYPAPAGGRPIAITTEIGECPWAPSHKLVLIGARAKHASGAEEAGRNIVLLVDVSGSMAPPERLPLLRSAFSLFADTLRPDDRLSIVTYAGYSGVALPPTPAARRDVIQRAIAGLGAGGSTNGAQGLVTAYRVARESYVPGGVNRMILATDGDFNVGVVNRQDLVRLIEREKESGVFLSVLGVGTDNLKDATMEMLADKGNGNYAYLDTLQEARRVLVREGASTLETVAKDVKFQVEFNPAVVAAWKQIGYEDRALAAEDFNDDRKDGGELGADHTVTVLYEIVPVGAEDHAGPNGPVVDPLKYQAPTRSATPSPAARSGEWLTVKARYKAPEGETSDVMSVAARSGAPTRFLPFAAAIAEYGLLLRDGAAGDAPWSALDNRLAAMEMPASLAADSRDFRELVAIARGLARNR